MPSETKPKADNRDRDEPPETPADGSAADGGRDDDGDGPDVPAEKSTALEPRDNRRDDRPARSGKPGFFTVYKKGQGKWTRLGTWIGAGLIGVATAYHIYYYLKVFINIRPVLDAAGKLTDAASAAAARTENLIALAAAAGFLALYTFIIWRITNKPDTVDFLIATDSEMKKVNWTSRKDLIGSTKVVILFMVFIALFLFACDLLFAQLFKLFGVLKFGPFDQPGAGPE
jgi:preprotein translocase SecE subunit